MSAGDAGSARPAGGVDIEMAGSGGACVVALAGEHDLSTLESIRAALAERRAGLATVFDLTQTTFVDSSVVNLIATLSRDARAAEGPGVAVAVSPGSHPARVLELGAVGELVSIHESREQALRALGLDD